MTDIIDFKTQKLVRTEPDYTVYIWRGAGKFSSGIHFGEGIEQDTLEVAQELIALGDALVDATGYEPAWYQGLLDERWYVLGGFVLGSAITGVLCALLSG